MIHVSQSALREIKRLESRDTFGSGVVRLAIAPGGCAGLIYHLSFGQTTKPNDHVLKIDHLKIVISPDALANCDGLTVDYTEDLTGGNFCFNNPLAKQTCGCGVSFSLEAKPPTAPE
jgi:iron-sulfur cluster assembly protein